MTASIKYDVLIIGSGASGLGLALSLADQFNIAVLCKDDLQTSASQRAQGGIAAVMDESDSSASHINDTINAGAGLCDPVVVEYTITHAKAAINRLISQGVQFTTTSGKHNYHLTQEGGHSHRRIIHAADKTGAAVVKTLAESVKEHPNIFCFTETTALEILVDKTQAYGAHALNNQSGQIQSIYANVVVLATGGASMTYLHTTNPGHTSGDGIAIAFNAGARIANMEFNQFHPTCFYNPDGDTFLISEVLRGEGAKLIFQNGERFMDQYDPRAELAPRDIVARAIDNEMKTKKQSHVYLDISHEPVDKIKSFFPSIYKMCLQQGIDITQTPIPVVPAAHYTCGGIVTNLNGQTDIQGLYAIGEVACTGLHGANRMASNSLLECLVFANSASIAIQQQLNQFKGNHAATVDNLPEEKKTIADPAEIAALIKRLRTTLWENVGIVRTNKTLAQAAAECTQIEQQFTVLWSNAKLSKTLIELRNMIITAKLIIFAAIERKESRGTHFNSDYPQKLLKAQNTILVPGPEIKIEFSDDIHSLVPI